MCLSSHAPTTCLAFVCCLQVEEQTAKLIKSHVELYSSVKELDLVVLLDISGSMECYLDGVRGHIKDVLEQIAVRYVHDAHHVADCAPFSSGMARIGVRLRS